MLARAPPAAGLDAHSRMLAELRLLATSEAATQLLPWGGRLADGGELVIDVSAKLAAQAPAAQD